tara:strand:+ start:963 stop:1154 length:192 start_codon:yes stop_codon:yes gene_type:complete
MKRGVKSVSMLKEIHSRMSKNREMVRVGYKIEKSELHEIQDLAQKIIKLTYEIQTIQRENEND